PPIETTYPCVDEGKCPPTRRWVVTTVSVHAPVSVVAASLVDFRMRPESPAAKIVPPGSVCSQRKVAFLPPRITESRVTPSTRRRRNKTLSAMESATEDKKRVRRMEKAGATVLETNTVSSG